MSNPFFSLFGKTKKEPDREKPLEDKVLEVIDKRCPQNHTCPSVRVCPVGALSQEGYRAPTVDMSKCIKCGKCTKSCPLRALVFT